MRIFTDGACSGNPGPGGWGCLFTLPNKTEKYSGFEESTTNNRMELTAVVEALNIIINNIYKYNIKEIQINSDSAYVVNAINQNWIDLWQKNNWKTSDKKNVKNYDLWKKLLETISNLKWCGINVLFVKVKGHSGNSFNELVDELAKNEIVKNSKGVRK